MPKPQHRGAIPFDYMHRVDYGLTKLEWMTGMVMAGRETGTGIRPDEYVDVAEQVLAECRRRETQET